MGKHNEVDFSIEMNGAESPQYVSKLSLLRMMFLPAKIGLDENRKFTFPQSGFSLRGCLLANINKLNDTAFIKKKLVTQLMDVY